MRLLFDYENQQKQSTYLPKCDVERTELSLKRKQKLHLPVLCENEISRHYTELAKQTHGVNDGFYPLGSCTMKYNPKINDVLASLGGFTEIHPLQDLESVQGCLELMKQTEKALCTITGMDAMTFQPAAGAHGEFCGLLLIKKYHEMRNDLKRNKIIIPDSAHGTNPASASMAGFKVVTIASKEDGCVDLDALRQAVGEDTAGLMLTNPNTVGLFDKHILEITQIIHDAGGLNYYDGANLNAIMGIARPGDMGFDVIHLNLHKTFSTPHGGGGPGSGPCGCKQFLADYLPGVLPCLTEEGYAWHQPKQSVGAIKAFYGNFLVVVKTWAYLLTLGSEGIREAAQNAVLNANYMMHQLKDTYDLAYDQTCMHEFVISLNKEKHDCNVSAMDIAKALLDYGIHPPTMYFPLIVHEALMIEPTETETLETLDRAVDVFKKIMADAMANPENVHQAPLLTPVRRLDEVKAAREPHLRYIWPDDE